MVEIIATLRVPDLSNGKGRILAVSTDETLLLAFRRQVPKGLEEELAQADNEVEALILRADLNGKRRLLGVLIPDVESNGHPQG